MGSGRFSRHERRDAGDVVIRFAGILEIAGARLSPLLFGRSPRPTEFTWPLATGLGRTAGGFLPDSDTNLIVAAFEIIDDRPTLFEKKRPQPRMNRWKR